MDYVSWIRSKVGHDKIFLPFAAGILLNAEGKILLQKRADKEVWDLPGGIMELGESAVETLIREFKEETGLTVTPLRLFGAYTKYQESYPSGDVPQAVGMVYEVVAAHPEQALDFTNSETLELAFFSQEECQSLQLAGQQTVDILADYFAGHYPLNR